MIQNHINEKAQNLLACIQYGLQLHSEQSTAVHLGDRTKYIGLSDIGRALECPEPLYVIKHFQGHKLTYKNCSPCSVVTG